MPCSSDLGIDILEKSMLGPETISYPLAPLAGIEEDALVVSNRNLSGGGFILTLKAPRLSRKLRPGQFVHFLVPGDLFLRRPFSVMDVLPKKNLILIYGRRVGSGSELMAAMTPGMSVSLMGPLGHAFDLAETGKNPILVAGGTGAGVLFMLARVLGEKKLNPLVLYGARNKSELSLASSWRGLAGVRLLCSTDDGSVGFKGNVVGLLKKCLRQKDPTRSATVTVCGPVAMMSAAAKEAEGQGLRCLVSLEQRMGCAVGACYACAFPMKNRKGYESYVRVCRQGTVFRAREIDWDKAGSWA